MIEAVLPEGYSARAPSRDDAAAIAEVLAACQRADGDMVDASAEVQLDNWEGLDLNEDALLLLAPDGRIVAAADVYNRSFVRVSTYGAVDPAHRGRGLGAYLVRWGENWAREHMTSAPVGYQVDVQHYIRASNAPAVELIESLDYHPVRGVYVMELTLDQPPPAPKWPAGIVARAFVPGVDERATFDAVEEAFRDLWGRPPGEYDRWLAHTVSERNDPELWRLALDRDSGAIAGVCLCKITGGKGWVASVGVRQPWRARGVGLALLRDAFGVYWGRGVREIGLSVDAESLTGAPRLYARAGMHVAKNFTIYRKILRPGAELATIADAE